MRPIAIFDIDGTIFRSSLTIELFEHLVRAKVFPVAVMEKVRRSEQKWLNRQGHYDAYVEDVVAAYQKGVIGKKRNAIVAASRRVIREQKYRTYRYTRKLLERIRGEYLTIGVSGSPLEVVREYNKFLKLDKLYGWEFGLDERGRYTSAVLHAPPQYKKELVVRYVTNHNLSLRGSIGVGDSDADLGFLALVETPICFNPNTTLAAEARRRNWTIVVERKDLVMEFKAKNVKFLKI